MPYHPKWPHKWLSDQEALSVRFIDPPVIEYRDVYVNFSPLFKRAVVSYAEKGEDPHRIPACLLGSGQPTRIHYENSTAIIKFTDKLKSTLVEASVNLFLQDDLQQQGKGDEGKKVETKDVATQLDQLWYLITTFPKSVTKLMVRLAEPDCYELHNKEKIVEDMIYDDSLFFDFPKVRKLCRLYDRVELHVKCNAIQAEHVPELIDFFDDSTKSRHLTIYISEFALYLDSINVTQNEGIFKSGNKDVEVKQVGMLVTLCMGHVRIRFEDEYRALEIQNFEFK